VNRGAISATVPREAASLRLRAEHALAAKLAEVVELDATSRCRAPELNLVDTITERQWATIAQQLRRGDGGELAEGDELPPKFCSAFSSTALAVNSFGFFVHRGVPMPLINAASVLGEPQFEAKRSAGVRGFRPNLDVVFESSASERFVFVESKCLEYLRGHGQGFSAAYVERARATLGTRAASTYERFEAGRMRFALLDAGQLLKHFLAAKRSALLSRRKIDLLYVFWQPVDAARYEIFATHRNEASLLAEQLDDEHVRLVPADYGRLWATWASSSDDDLRRHAQALMKRYEIRLRT
jgi:hypothetical protein